MCSVAAYVVQHTAPGPSCGPGHVAPAPLAMQHASVVWQVMHAHGGGSTSGNELVSEQSQNDTFSGSVNRHCDHDTGSNFKSSCFQQKESTALGSTEKAEAKHHWSFFRAAIVVVSLCDCYFQFSLIVFGYLIYLVLTGAVCHRLRRQYPAANTDVFVCDEVVYSDANLNNFVQPQLYKCTIVPSQNEAPYETAAWKMCTAKNTLSKSVCFFCIGSESWSNKMVYHSTVHSITLSSLIRLFIWHLYLFFDSIHPLNATFYYLYSCSSLFGGQPALQNSSQTSSQHLTGKYSAKNLHLLVHVYVCVCVCVCVQVSVIIVYHC